MKKIAKRIRRNLITLSKNYGKAAEMGQSGVSRKFYGRGTFLRDFAKGKQSMSIDKLERVLEKFEAEWPKGKKRPVLDPLFM